MSAATTIGPRWLNAASGLPRKYMTALAALLALLLLAAFLATAPLRWAVIGVSAGALGVSLLIEPALGLFLLAVAIPWSGSVTLPFPAVGAADILVAMVAVLWLARGVVQREIKLRLPPLSGVILLFVWVAGLSLTQAFSWADGAPEWLKWAEFALLYLVASQMLGPKSVKWLMAGLFMGGLSQVALGAYQFLRQVGPEAFILPGGYLRAYGSFNQPNPYAGYLGYLVPVAASLGLWAAGRWRRERRRRDLILALVLAAVTGALVAGIVMSWSRGGWVGLLAALVIVAGLRSWRTALVTAAIVVALALVVTVFGTSWLPGSITGRLQDLGSYAGGPDPARTEITDENFSVLERLAHWQAGLRMFGDQPWLGVGIGNYGVNYARYPQPYFYDPLGHAHNVFINFAAETGVLGLGAFLLFWLGVACFAARLGWARRGWISALAIGVLGTWTYLTVHGMFDNLFVQHMQLQLALLLAALAWPVAAAPALSQSGRSDDSRTTHRTVRVG
jgi:putative inorganic carbon (hco3(-)) transporter